MQSNWDALKLWGKDIHRIEKLTGGTANDVWSVRIGNTIAVARLGRRSDADLDWETKLLNYLSKAGLKVPIPFPTLDGRMFASGLVVMSKLEGAPPQTSEDWRRVAKTLKQLHSLTTHWTQRPGWVSSTDLLTIEKGTKIDLSKMHPDGVERCRAAWAKIQSKTKSVVHGDPNPRNILMTEHQVGLIDWDEAHLDVSDLDLALPHNAADLNAHDYDKALQASAAWEAAVCWGDDYAVKRLGEVRTIKSQEM